MVVKWPIIPVIGQGPIFRLCPLINTQLFMAGRICNEKGTESKGREKEKERSKKEIRNTHTHFAIGLLHQTEILYTFVANLRENYLFDKKWLFLAKRRPV